MHNIILFRGGMCGDLILGMINKDYLHTHGPTEIEDSVCNQYKIKTDRQIMKKFFRYSNEEKEEYFKKFENNDSEYTLSHDTDFCLTKKENTIQIISSDSSMFQKCATRFEEKHRDIVIEEAKKYIENTADTFVENYANSLKQWQDAFKFSNTFDIKNIGTSQFPDDVFNNVQIKDKAWSLQIYDTWLSKPINL